VAQQLARSNGLEWPTIWLIAGFYGAFGVLTWFWHDLPWWLTWPAAVYLTGLYGSLQHEAIHGHPSPWHWLNQLSVLPGLLVWVPYGRYRDLHLRHHTNDHLTDPYDDPESYYWSPDDWVRMPALAQALFRANNTLAGRLILGPAISAMRFWGRDVRLLAGGNSDVVRAWLLHVPALAVLYLWISTVCGISAWVYLAAFAYPGTSLILLRSYAEHRAHAQPDARTAIVETCPAMALLFLNNNLHAVHHARPELAWYKLPDAYKAHRRSVLGRNDGYLIKGYVRLFLKYFIAAKEPVPHPLRDHQTS